MQNVERKTEVNPAEQPQNGAIKRQQDLASLEAALYVAGRPLDLNDMCSALRTRSKNKARKLAAMLAREYASRNTALEILVLKDDRFVLQLKPEFSQLAKRFVSRPLLSTGPLKTLSYIAFRQPISQKRVVEVRGHHAYGHVKVLKDMDLLTTDRSGRSTVLRTTDYFADYFGLSNEIVTMKRELKKFFQDLTMQEAPDSQNE